MKPSSPDSASRHLGKRSAYPERYDPSVLVAVPRWPNRKAIGYPEPVHAATLPFLGCDIWNVYEVSCLLESGLPVVAVLRFSYPASSPNIVESKSLKLYLNSLNMEPLGVDRDSALDALRRRVESDLAATVGAPVKALLVATPHSGRPHPCAGYTRLETLHPQAPILRYIEHRDTLEIVEGDEHQRLRVCSALLRSRCRETQQPDWGDVFIEVEGPKVPTTESLLRYLVSFRNENHFHEEIVEAIYYTLWNACKPALLSVFAQYTRRGGIDINPLRRSATASFAQSLEALESFVPTARQ